MLPIDSKTSVSNIQDSMLNQQGLDAIKTMGRDKNPDAIRQVAKQFEAMFMQQMLKTMRDTNDVFAEGNYLDTSQIKFHREMLDQQMVLNLTSGRGIGLAEQFYQSMMQSYGKFLNKPAAADDEQHEALHGEVNPKVTGELLGYAHISQSLESSDSASHAIDQLMQVYHGHASNNIPADDVTVDSVRKLPEQDASHKLPVSQSQQAFVAMLKPHAEKAARELNVNPEVLVAQAALETGWGKHVIHSPKGENSFNLFNIKAGEHWQGKTVNVTTQEFQQGVTFYDRADFKQYRSYADSFSDYVHLIKSNKRYQQALSVSKNSDAYAQELQNAGYATDPDYAEKIKQLLKTDAITSMAGLGKAAQSLLTLASQARQHLME